MNRIIVAIIVLIFGIKASADRANAEAASNTAYASMFKATPAPAPKPAPKPDGEAPKAKPAECKCADCKCENCPSDCLPVEWKWDATNGEYHKMQGATVLETRKYKRVAVTTCTKRGCYITEYKWVPAQ